MDVVTDRHPASPPRIAANHTVQSAAGGSGARPGRAATEALLEYTTRRTLPADQTSFGGAEPLVERIGAWLRGANTYLVFHVIGIVLLSVVAAAFPSVGPNRFVLAAILVFVVAPMVIVVQRRFPTAEHGWSEPLFNVVCISLLVHLVPAAWFGALVVGLLVAAISSIRVQARGYILYAGLNLLLVAGMTIAALVHGVPGWGLPIAAVLATLPCTTFYAYWEYTHVTSLRDRARRVRDLSLIAGGVAHDFRNILTAVSGYAELAKVELPRDHPARASVDELSRGAERASLLAGQLLALSGSETAGIADVNLGEEIHSLTKLLRTVVPKGVDVETDIDARVPLPFVRGYKAELQQVIMNLVLNAAEASAATRSPVRVGVWYEPCEEGGTGRVVCEIKDRGAGISANHLPKIFDPFFTSKPRGHGLGLTGVHRILSQHQGEIEVESQLGKGTRARFWLPASTSANGSCDNTLPSRTPGGYALVVDDEGQIRDVLRRFLSRLGYDTFEAEDGVRGVERFREHAESVDFVIMDVRMPRMDGLRCSKLIREIRPDVPIIISTAYAPSPLTDGPDQMTFLPKPYRYHDLERTLQEVVGTLN